MNEEEFMRENHIDLQLGIGSKKQELLFNFLIQKGKLEQKKEELEFLLIMKEHIETNNCPLPTLRLNDRIKQLQKEIGGGVSKE